MSMRLKMNRLVGTHVTVSNNGFHVTGKLLDQGGGAFKIQFHHMIDGNAYAGRVDFTLGTVYEINVDEDDDSSIPQIILRID